MLLAFSSIQKRHILFQIRYICEGTINAFDSDNSFKLTNVFQQTSKFTQFPQIFFNKNMFLENMLFRVCISQTAYIFFINRC